MKLNITAILCTLLVVSGLLFADPQPQEIYSIDFENKIQAFKTFIPDGGIISVKTISISTFLFNGQCSAFIRSATFSTPVGDVLVTQGQTKAAGTFNHANGASVPLSIEVVSITGDKVNDPQAPNGCSYQNKKVSFTIHIEPSFFCTDPDAIDADPRLTATTVEVEGYRPSLDGATIESTEDSFSASDRCLLNQNHLELSCGDGNVFESTESACDDGYSCQDGACVPQAENVCQDSDGGIDLNEQGAIAGVRNGANYENFDSCVDGNTVREYSCFENLPQNANFDCANGFTCQDGACAAPQANSCQDTDGGQIATTAGTVSGIRNGAAYAFSDSCVDGDTVQEYACFGANFDNVNLNCAAGFVCQAGACVDPNAVFTCEDSDGGSDEDEKGTTTRLDENGDETESHTDVCEDSETVREYYCNGDDIVTDDVACDSDEVCRSGRCVSDDLLDDSLTASDYCAGKPVGLRDSIFYNNYEFRLSRIYDDQVRECTVAEIHIYKNGDRVSTIFGCPSENPYGRSNDDEEIDVYVCGVDEDDETAYLDVSVLEDNLDLEFQCRDSDDGRDADERGTVVVGTYDDSNGELLETHAAQDVCIGTKVREFYCSNDDLKMTELSCGAQETCESGRCVPSQDLYCTDSDGNDLMVKGTSESGYMRNGQRVVLDRATDVCQAEKVRELVCNGDSPGAILQSCPPGSSCVDGACASQTTTYSVSLKRGWNAFSVPLSDATVKSTTCRDFSLNRVWAYSGNYYHPTYVIPGSGMWFMASNDCTVTFQGESYEFSQGMLSQGWNIVGFDKTSRETSDVFDRCEVRTSVWEFDAMTQGYRKVTQTSPGKAYFVRVNAPCETRG